MWNFECSTHSAATRAGVWGLWSDPARWPEFDPSIEWATLEGPFEAGATIRVKPKGGPASKLAIVSAEPEQGFAGEVALPLARMRFEHSVAEAPEGGTWVSSRIRVRGPLSPLFPRLFHLRRNGARLVENLARLAEAEEHTGGRPPDLRPPTQERH